MIAEGAAGIAAYIASHRLQELFIEELGWDRAAESFRLSLDGDDYQFNAVANKRGFLAFACQMHRTVLANRGRLRLLQKAVSQHYHEHILIFHCEEPVKQVWQWSTVGEDGRRRRHREHPFFSSDPPASLLSRLELLRFSFDEEASATFIDAISRVRNALDVSSELELFARFPSFASQSDALAVRMRAGDKDAFEEFVLFHERLATKASRMLYHWVGLNEEDAAQIAMLGVIEAAKRFDPAKGYQFSTYAIYWIRQQCQRYGVNEGMLIRFPGYIFWPAYKFEFEHRRLIATLGDRLEEQDVDEALGEFGLKKAHWNTYCAARDAVQFTDLDRSELEEIRSRATTDELPIDHLIQEETTHIVLSEMMNLRERDCQVIGARYGLVHDEMTLQECAEQLGITRERVRQIQARGEEDLKNILRRNYPDLYEI